MKIFLSRLVVCALVLFGTGTSVWADFVRDSGVDLDTSTLTIEFDEADLTAYSALENPPFQCFGETTSPVTVSFAEAGVLVDTLTSTIEYGEASACFHQAGDYTVSYEVSDRAGNSAGSGTHSFTITPSDVNADQITYEITPDIQSDSYQAPVADGVNTLEYRMILRDFAGNPVTQIETSDIVVGDVEITLEQLGETDANKATGFDFGDGLFREPSAVNGPAQVGFSFRALVPTIKTVGYLAAFTDAWNLDFYNLEVPEIEDDGSKSSLIIRTLDPSTDPRIAFQPPFEVTPGATPDADGAPQVYLAKWEWKDNPPPGKDVYTEGNPSHIYFEPSNFSGGILDSDALSFEILSLDDTYLHFDEQQTGSPFIIVDSGDLNLDSGNLYWGIPGDGMFIGRTSNFVYDMASGEPYPLSFYIVGQYQVDGETVRYALGGSGLDGDYLDPSDGVPPYDDTLNFVTRNLGNIDPTSESGVLGYHTLTSGALPPPGVDIVGNVFGAVDDWGTSTDSTVFVGEVPAGTDVRAEMFEKTVRLIRGIPEACKAEDYSGSGIFESCDVVLIDKSDALASNRLVTLSDLPSGAKTLVVLNGNVLISDDLKYDENNTKAFGLITFQTPVEPFPEYGNVFVHSDVQHIQMHLFADGMFANNDTGLNFLDSNTGTFSTDKQLLFQGTFLTNNRLGGSRDDESLMTPWGVLTLQNKPDWGSGGTLEDIARVYDLHYVRQGNDNLLTPLTTNENAFVIEVDPPSVGLPGFTQ